MAEQPVRDDDQLDRQLAELEANPHAPMDTSIRQLHAELETIAEALKEPLPPDPHEEEPACRRAMEQVKALVQSWTANPANDSQPAVGVADEEPVPDYLEHFRILKKLGQGGMGAVYLAEDTRLGREVALKTLRAELAAKPSARERFLREARLAASLEHDHIVPIYHVGESAGIPYLAMPLLKGRSLEVLLKSTPNLSAVEVARLGRQIAAGLAAAHERGLIHRDIKPSNIWIEPIDGGRVKILDFGLAKTADADETLTDSGTILGTPAYMAPEQARGEKVDARADLWSLGVILYELATGRRPFTGSNTMAILSNIALVQPPPPQAINSSVPAALSDLVMQLLEKDPAKRPASARAVIAALEALERPPSDTQTLAIHTAVQPSGSEATVALPPAASAGPSRRRLHWAIAAGLLLLAGGGVLLPQIILRITDKEGKTREIELKPGDRIEIVEKPAPAEAPPKKPPEVKIITGTNPDRRAAEYVLSIGGVVRINGQPNDIRAIAELPNDEFRLTYVELTDKVSDAGLAHFKDCKNLTHLSLNNSSVTDAGFVHFKDCKNLTHLSLNNSSVTDAGLVYFKDCKNLTYLGLNQTGLTDAGLAYFKDCKDLTALELAGTHVTDAGLAQLKDYEDLTYLQLEKTQVTDAGLAHLRSCKKLRIIHLWHTRVAGEGLVHLKECKDLTHLNLGGTRVDDAGLAHLKDCKNLTYLNLVQTQVTDAGLVHLKDCKSLKELNLGHTQVTDKSLDIFIALPKLTSLGLQRTRISQYGFDQLIVAMPACTIDGSEPNRLAAQQVLALGGAVEIAEPGQAPRPLKMGEALPAKFFQLRRVVLKDCKQPVGDLFGTLAALRFAEIDRLEAIDLAGTPLQDVGFLASIHGLRDLDLARTGVSDNHLAALPKVRRLVLDGNVIGVEGFQSLAKQTDLTELSLAGVPISDLTVKYLSGLKGLKRLSLAQTILTDDGLRHLHGLANLTELDLRQTKVTKDGVAALQKALPKCEIKFDGSHP